MSRTIRHIPLDAEFRVREEKYYWKQDQELRKKLMYCFRGRSDKGIRYALKQARGQDGLQRSIVGWPINNDRGYDRYDEYWTPRNRRFAKHLTSRYRRIRGKAEAKQWMKEEELVDAWCQMGIQ